MRHSLSFSSRCRIYSSSSNMAPTSRWLGPALDALTEAASRSPPLGLMEPLDLSLGGGQALNGKFSMS